MQQRTLGTNGLMVSAIGLGCMGMSGTYGTVDEEEAIATIRRALDIVPAEQLVINPDCGCVRLPRDVAFNKLSAMVEGTRIVRKELPNQ
jgi:5-methyltetrahydropteroyltriglutamate--homocysteine methyltransferase